MRFVRYLIKPVDVTVPTWAVILFFLWGITGLIHEVFRLLKWV